MSWRVMMPWMRGPSTTGTARNLYLLKTSATVAMSSSVSTVDDVGVHERAQLLLPAAEKEVAEGDDAGQPPVLAGHVDVGDRFQGMDRVPEGLDGVGDRLVPRRGRGNRWS